MTNFKAPEPSLFYSFPLQVQEQAKLDALMDLLEASGVKNYITSYDHCAATGRPAFNPYQLFAAIVLGFSLGKASLREIEAFSKFDLRFIYLTGESSPDHSTIGRFINQSIKPNIDKIFACIMAQMFKQFGATMDTVFIDGTKQEARPNKYKFVWKPTYFHQRLCGKIRSLLQKLGLSSDVPSEGIFHSNILLKKLGEAQKIIPEEIGITKVAFEKMKSSLYEYLQKALEYEEKERICGINRNSYYKTDHDATAMCLKEDYYSGIGSNMHAAYNVQIMVSHGLIVSFYVSQNRSDALTLKPALLRFHEMYHHFPERLGADAGYGSFDNYKFCFDNKISAFIKYGAWSGESSGRNPALYEYLEDGSIVCLGKRKGYPEIPPKWHPGKRGAILYLVKDCDSCEFMHYCRRFNKEREGSERRFEIIPQYSILKQKARDMLLSREGIEMRINRSCQVEGAFGVIKSNMSYDRFRRISLERVSTEFALTCLGYNFRKFMRYSKKGELAAYWNAPEDLQPEKFKQPSAKRIERRMSREKTLQPNEMARAVRRAKKRRGAAKVQS